MSDMGRGFAGKVGFSIGTGRCGTEFMARVVGLEPQVAASHERNPFNETFQRYSKWYGLPVDDEGFLYQKEQEILQDLQNHTFSFESSAYLSLSVRELYDRFGAKFVLLVRSPERVVNSFFHKGWYLKPTIRKDPNLGIGYQECESFHHVLARFTPSGEKFTQWNEMTRVGKIAWFWNALNARVIELFDALPATHWRIEKLEELNYSRYIDLANYLGFSATLSQSDYEALAGQRPNAFSNVPTVASWSEQETAEFEAEVAPMAAFFGYEYRVEKLPVPQTKPAQSIQKPSLFAKLRSSIVR